jgi:hypothetical protein
MSNKAQALSAYNLRRSVGSYLVAKSNCDGLAASHLKAETIETGPRRSADPSATTSYHRDLLDQAKKDMFKAIQQAPMDATTFLGLVRQQNEDIDENMMGDIMSVHSEATLEGSSKGQEG